MTSPISMSSLTPSSLESNGQCHPPLRPLQTELQPSSPHPAFVRLQRMTAVASFQIVIWQTLSRLQDLVLLLTSSADRCRSSCRAGLDCFFQLFKPAQRQRQSAATFNSSQCNAYSLRQAPGDRGDPQTPQSPEEEIPPGRIQEEDEPEDPIETDPECPPASSERNRAPSWLQGGPDAASTDHDSARAGFHAGPTPRIGKIKHSRSDFKHAIVAWAGL